MPRATDILDQGDITGSDPQLSLHWTLFHSGHFCLTSTSGMVSVTSQLDPEMLDRLHTVISNARAHPGLESNQEPFDARDYFIRE